MNKNQDFILLDECLNRLPSTQEEEFLLCFGQNDDGNLVFDDISHFKDAFIAGDKGSGKSVLLRSLILTLMNRHSPNEIKFILFDSKNCDLAQFNETPHLYCPLISDINSSKIVLDEINNIIKERFELCTDLEVSNINDYNLKVDGRKKLPKIIIVIDELNDFIDVEKSLIWPLSFGASMGIHFLIASDLSRINSINDVILDKSKLKIALKIDNPLTFKKFLKEDYIPLLGNGDLLIKLKKERVIHAQGPYLDGIYISSNLENLKKKYPNDFYDEDFVKTIKENLESLSKYEDERRTSINKSSKKE